MIEPGWYKDPVDPTVQRFWDGEGWAGEPVPADAAPPAGPPPVYTPPPPPPPRPSVATEPDLPDVPEPQLGAVILPPGTTMPPGGFPPGQLPPGAIVLPPGAPVPPGLQPQGTLPAGAVQVLLPPQHLRDAPLPLPHGRQIATLGTRLLARLIDIAMLLLINTVVTGWLVYQYLREIWPAVRQFQASGSASDIVPPDRAGRLEIIILIVVAALWFAYEVPSIAGSGQTLGKRLLKIKVMRVESEEPVGFARAIRRWNPLGLSVLLWACGGLGFVLQFVDSLSPVIDWPLHRAFHDRSAGTVVVRDVSPLPGDPT